MIPILTVACRFNGQHDDCAGSIYLGSSASAMKNNKEAGRK
jgi:hypothetical protein